MSRPIKFRALYEGDWHYQTLEEVITITLAAFRLGAHKTQFTGLADKNGTEIYEGDIVLYQHSEGSIEYKGEVFYRTQFASFWLKTSEESGFGLLGAQKVITIIGNIYQNPELLNQQP